MIALGEISYLRLYIPSIMFWCKRDQRSSQITDNQENSQKLFIRHLDAARIIKKSGKIQISSLLLFTLHINQSKK